MKFLSYAQNFEDLMLWRALGHVENGFYVDVGANDPVVDSTTKAFYERGWHGINIEPMPKHFEDLEQDRPRDINLNVALGSEVGELQLWDFGVRGWGTLDAAVLAKHKANGHQVNSRTVPVTTLAAVLQNRPCDPIHFLKIDVEGFEKNVIEGADFHSFRPWIVVIESTFPNSREESFLEWEKILLSARYAFCYFDGLNRFYISEDHPELKSAFSAPPNVFDEFELYSESLLKLELNRVELALANAERELVDRQLEFASVKTELDRLQGRLDLITSSLTWRIRTRVRSLLSVVFQRS